jgi:hypothetical protein
MNKFSYIKTWGYSSQKSKKMKKESQVGSYKIYTIITRI